MREHFSEGFALAVSKERGKAPEVSLPAGPGLSLERAVNAPGGRAVTPGGNVRAYLVERSEFQFTATS